MGLDMYLYAKKYIWTKYDKNNPNVEQEFESEVNKVIGQKGSIGKVKYITYEIMYWRKANAIHKWFVDNVQDGKDDCESYDVSKEDIQKLYKVIGEVLKDHDKAEELLPTSSGFFFGGTEYDEYYWSDLEDTYNKLGEILHDKENKYEGFDFEYSSSW
jgi:hypothetical protein